MAKPSKDEQLAAVQEFIAKMRTAATMSPTTGTSVSGQLTSEERRIEQMMKDMKGNVDKFKGEKDANIVLGFLDDVDAVFEYAETSNYFTEQERVIWVRSLLSDKAKSWWRTSETRDRPNTWTNLRTMNHG